MRLSVDTIRGFPAEKIALIKRVLCRVLHTAMVDFVRRLLQVNGARAHVPANVYANVCEATELPFRCLFRTLYRNMVCRKMDFIVFGYKVVFSVRAFE